MKDKDYLFGFLIITITLALIAFGFLAVLKSIDLTKAAIIITFLTSSASFLIGYRWGSSKGSKDKDAIIANEQNTKTTQP